MEAGGEFPPILVFYDEPNNLYILVDGFHRYAAHMRVKPNDPILAEMRLGSVEDARWESIGANKSHGLRRTNEDKRNAVKQALLHPKGTEMSNRQIADHVGVHHVTVGTVRNELESSGEIHQMKTRTVYRGDQVYQQNTGGINSDRKTPPPGATCAICSYFEKSACQRDGSQPLPWTAACDHYTQKEEVKPSQQDSTTEKSTEGIKDENPQKTRSKNPNQYERIKGCETLLLPKDNPQLFAVELRNRFDPEYLVACMGALRHLLMDKGD